MSLHLQIGEQQFNWEAKEYILWTAALPDGGVKCIVDNNGTGGMYQLQFIRNYMEDHFGHLEASHNKDDFFDAWDFINGMLKASLMNSDEKWIDLDAKTKTGEFGLTEENVQALQNDIEGSDISKESVPTIEALIEFWKENNV